MGNCYQLGNCQIKSNTFKKNHEFPLKEELNNNQIHMNLKASFSREKPPKIENNNEGVINIKEKVSQVIVVSPSSPGHQEVFNQNNVKTISGIAVKPREPKSTMVNNIL